jgi:hypothetical protein
MSTPSCHLYLPFMYYFYLQAPGQATSFRTIKPTPIKIYLGSCLEPDLDIRVNPNEISLKHQIPSLNEPAHLP